MRFCRQLLILRYRWWWKVGRGGWQKRNPESQSVSSVFIIMPNFTGEFWYLRAVSHNLFCPLYISEVTIQNKKVFFLIPVSISESIVDHLCLTNKNCGCPCTFSTKLFSCYGSCSYVITWLCNLWLSMHVPSLVLLKLIKKVSCVQATF